MKLIRIENKNAFIAGGLSVDVSFAAKEGSYNFLTGPNGCGKTTFLNYLKSNQQKLFPGLRASFMDQDRLKPLSNISAEEAISIVKEECGTDAHMFSYEGFSKVKGRKVSELSGGENQLLKLALATLAPFDVLFADEPFLNLDAQNKEVFLQTFDSLLERGKTLVVVEHDLERFGRRGAFINRMRLCEGKVEMKHERI